MSDEADKLLVDRWGEFVSASVGRFIIAGALLGAAGHCGIDGAHRPLNALLRGNLPVHHTTFQQWAMIVATTAVVFLLVVNRRARPRIALIFMASAAAGVIGRMITGNFYFGQALTGATACGVLAVVMGARHLALLYTFIGAAAHASFLGLARGFYNLLTGWMSVSAQIAEAVTFTFFGLLVGGFTATALWTLQTKEIAALRLATREQLEFAR